jgi:hypothetical protein
MILLSELSRRRIRSIQKLIRVGRNEVVVVMRVDKEKGAIPDHFPTLPATSSFAGQEVADPMAQLSNRQVTLICQNDEYQPRMSSNVRSDTINRRLSILLCDMWQRKQESTWTQSIK